MKIKTIIFDMHGVLFEYGDDLDYPIVPIKAGIDLLDALSKESYCFYGCTNWNGIIVDQISTQYPYITNHFEAIIYPEISGYKKPHFEMFNFLMRTYDLEPQETLLLDDAFQNIEAAHTFGMQGIHIQNFIDVYPELSKLGINIGSN